MVMNDGKDLVTRLEIEPIRKAFPKEAAHFTTWLESHIEALAERVGMQLTVVQREKSVGDFNVDLLCEDDNGRPVIIENQLERTDHDHLGKVLTYLVNLDASTAIWVTTDPRPEHHRVIDWLNESTAADISFYLVKVEAIRIGNSPFAPLFTVLSAPDKQVREFGDKKKEWAERHFARFEFWKGLLEKSKAKTKLFSNLSPSRYDRVGTGAGKSGCWFNFVVKKDTATIELYIDHDQDTGQKNKAIFDALHVEKETIEREFGSSLNWERLDTKRGSRINKLFPSGGWATPDKWEDLQMKMIDAMIRFDKTLRSRITKISV